MNGRKYFFVEEKIIFCVEKYFSEKIFFRLGINFIFFIFSSGGNIFCKKINGANSFRSKNILQNVIWEGKNVNFWGVGGLQNSAF